MEKIAVLVGPGFEDPELALPLDRLREAGHDIELLGRAAGEEIVGRRGEVRATVRAAAGDRDARDYAAVLIPGGRSPAHLRGDAGVLGFLREFATTGRPIAAICHGPQLLIAAGLVAGRRMTGWPSVRGELRAAGATAVDEEVVVDGSFITSRGPEDLGPFCVALLDRLAPPGGAREGQRVDAGPHA